MDTNSKLSNDTAVILVSHGSTLPYAEEVFVKIKEGDKAYVKESHMCKKRRFELPFKR